MNILYIEPATNFSGGVNQTILNVIELKKRLHRIIVACVKGSPIHNRLEKEGFEFIFIDEEKSLYSAKVIRKFLSSCNVDIVHTSHSKGHKIGLLSLMGRKRENLVVQRSVVFPATNIFKYLNPRVDMFVANSLAVKKVLSKYLVSKKRIRVVYSAANPQRFDINVDKKEVKRHYGFGDKFVFGVVGNYSDYKGHDIALEAFSLIKNKDNAIMVFVGQNTEKLKNKAKTLGIEKHVVVLGFRSEARKIMKGFDCLVVPSLKESFPNVVIEAFFLKTPVLGTDVGGIPELLENGRGFLCKPTLESMVNAFIMVYNFPDMERITDEAYKFALENLTIEKKIDKLEIIYKELASK